MSEFTAKKLKEARVRAGFTQDEAAKLMNLKKTTMSEMEVREAVTDISEKNKVYKTVLRGAGAYRHFIPAVDCMEFHVFRGFVIPCCNT